MEDLIIKLDKNREFVDDAFSALHETIKDIIVKAGGYINMANNDGKNDNVYSAVYDFCGAGEMVEGTIKAVKVEGNSIYCFFEPITSAKIIYTDEDFKEDEESWYFLDTSGEMVYHYTLLNLADVFQYHEYLSKE